MSANMEKASAGRNLLIYAAIVTFVAIYTARIWSERGEIEGYAYPTGLGDGEVYDLAANPLDPERPMVELDRVGYFATAGPDRRPDRYMVKVGRDDGDRYFVYQLSEEVGGGGVPEGGDYYLKLGADQYIKVAP